MKKLFYLLLLMPLAFLASCNNDDDLPEVDLKVTLSNVYQDPSTEKFYYVDEEGEDGEEAAPILIDGFSTVGQNSTVANARFALNNIVPLVWGTEPEEDQSSQLYVPTEYLREGVNYINISATVLQVDKSIAQCYLDVPVYVVSSTDELPAADMTLGTYSVTLKMQKDKK